VTSVRRFQVPPALVAVGTAAIYGTVDVAVPLGLSALGSLHGWNGTRPGPANLVGLPPLLGGLVVLVLAAAAHARALRNLEWRVLKVDREHLLTPDYLVTDGLYRLTRNPLYVGDLAIWLGWAILLGSLPVAAGLTALTVGLQLGVRLEERGLARQFGAEWRAYQRATPRFIGRFRQG
jgi:protein-S-isoprenylcysteine O-methyltransferase Ste14